MIKWTLVAAQTFRKIFAPALLALTHPNSEIWYAALCVTVVAGTLDVADAIRRAAK